MSMAAPAHPGTIIFVDGKTGEIVSTRQAADLPLEVAFAPSPAGLVPVVKVVALQQGARRFIREYGPDGELLRSTTQVRP